ncbi:MAG: HAD hydrolase-like protein [Azospirillaceae bacterium]|nr:HAD hydrolase-like protein [Azospirillaceae bacterium]
MIKAIIFDLDNCLSAADAIGPGLMDPVFQAIRATNAGTLDGAALLAAFADIWRLPLNVVAAVHGFTPAMRDAAWAATGDVVVTGPMAAYDDIGLLPAFDLPLFLVTTGFRRLQDSKIAAMGIAPHFREIHVDAIDQPGHRGKEAIFRDLMTRHGLDPAAVLVVGDNPEAELAAGRCLGAPTVQTLRDGVVWDGRTDHHVRGLADLRRLVAVFNG